MKTKEVNCVGNLLLRLVLYTKLIHLIYSDNSADNCRFSVNDKIFAKEREDATVFYPGIIVQILESGWINIRWEWRGFSHGSAFRVHESWIKDSNESRPRIVSYCCVQQLRIGSKQLDPAKAHCARHQIFRH